MRFATKRSRSGWTVRSFLATMYQLGFALQAVPSILWLNKSASGTPWVAQTSFLLLLGKVPREAPDAIRFQPDAPVCDFDVGEHVCGRKLVLLALRGLVGVRGECGDVDQPGNSVIGSRGCYHSSAVRVADEDGGASDPSERASYSSARRL